MKFPVARFAHLFGVNPEVETTGNTLSLHTSATTKPGAKKPLSSSFKSHAKPVAKQKPKASPGRFSHLVGPGSANHANTRSVHNVANAPRAKEKTHRPMTAAKTASRPMSATEAAKYIIDAGTKCRGAGEPRRTSERIADMTARAKVDRSAGIAAQIINAGSKARGEVPEVL